VPRSRSIRRGEHLYALFRPEFVMSYPSPLSSDAYTFFGAIDREQHNPEVLQGNTLTKQPIRAAPTLVMVGLDSNHTLAQLYHSKVRIIFGRELSWFGRKS
jgi:hypothetical protein